MCENNIYEVRDCTIVCQFGDRSLHFSTQADRRTIGLYIVFYNFFAYTVVGKSMFKAKVVVCSTNGGVD